MSKHSTTPRTLSRRLAALLAALALLAAMALPVYAEALDGTTQPQETVETDNNGETDNKVETGSDVETDDKSETNEGTGVGADTDSNDTNDNASSNPGANSTTPADNDPADAPDAQDPAAPDTAVAPNPAADAEEPAAETTTAEQDVLFADGGNTDVTAPATSGYTLYFVAPTAWEENLSKADAHLYLNVNFYDNKWQQVDMTQIGNTATGCRLYAINFVPNIDYATIYTCQFQCYVSKDHKAQFQPISNTTTELTSLVGRVFDGTTNAWSDYQKEYAGKTLYFKNDSTAELTSVKAVFYTWDWQSKKCKQVAEQEVGTVAAGTQSEVQIPQTASGFVRFTWTGGQSVLYKYSNIQYTDENTAGNESTPLNITTQNRFIYGADGNVAWGKVSNNVLAAGKTIYFDSTFSSYTYEGEESAIHQNAMPESRNGGSGKIYCFLQTADGSVDTVEMKLLDTDPTAPGRQLWFYNIPKGKSYTAVQFSAWNDRNRTAKDDMTKLWSEDDIPANLKEPCFFADNGDPSAYKDGDVYREGYWGEKAAVRDAESGKNTTKNTPVVDIKEGTFTQESGTKYITSTLYDYYTDYELNGFNRNTYPDSTTTSQRGYVTFEQFNRALSSAYTNGNVKYPLYTGHFQPSIENWGNFFAAVAPGMGLYGWGDVGSPAYKTFMAVNNSVLDTDGNGDNDSNKNFYKTFQGLVEDKTSDGKADGLPLLKRSDENKLALVDPHFNKDFLQGKNTFNTVLGKVYEDVSFPLKKAKVFAETQDGSDNNAENDAEYWYFDSNETSLYLKQDSNDQSYYLAGNGKNEASHNRSPGNGTSENNVDKGYGFFPFNEKVTGTATQYNYGFGAKLQFDFTLTSDGQVVVGNNKEKVPIKFFFSGDDDVWVYIDGELVLDVGGAHSQAAGLLEFGSDGEGSNTVTSWVSDAKTGGQVYKALEQGKEKTVKFGNIENNTSKPYTFKYKTEKPKPLKKQPIHTLTMFYMERGMWESNMAVAFNFPDHNELQVEKKVDVSGVNELFQKSFLDQKIFTFNIQNLATHYGETKTTEPTIKTATFPDTVYSSAKGGLSYVPSLPSEVGKGSAVLWKSDAKDPTSEHRDKRRGTLACGTIDITKYSYLTFDVYVKGESSETCALSNLYVELWDDTGNKKMGCLGTKGLRSSDVYGAATALHPGTWYTVRLMLNSLQKEDGFNNQVTKITVGDNYARSIYLRNFTFSSAPAMPEQKGFTTAQYDIPDYGSAKSGKLQNAAYAVYSSNFGNGDVVDENGNFLLQADEIVTFNDQFRRGSYIALKELTDTELYDTSWTVYENGVPVTKVNGNTKVVTVSDNRSLQNVKGTTPNDGRTEKVVADGELDGHPIPNAYKTTDQKPNADTLVFRSYSDKADENELTKLKVVFTNKVKTGKLIIRKVPAADEKLEGKEFTFTVQFGDVGGQSLGDVIKPQEYTCKVEEHDGSYYGEIVIDKIPVGTRFVVSENPTNGTSLKSVQFKGGKDCAITEDGKRVRGAIVQDSPVTATFENTARELIDITVNKVWQKQDGTVIKDGLPNAIYLQLQRTETPDDATSWKPVPEYESVELKPVDYEGWTKLFTGLDKYDANKYDANKEENKRVYYSYRVVEGTLSAEGKFEAKDTLLLSDGHTYTCTGGEMTSTTTEGKTSYTITLTNTRLNPKFTLDITKKDAENGKTPLAGVEFTLEKLDESGTDVDNGFTAQIGVTNADGKPMIKGTDGKPTDASAFTGLEAGKYRLTETKAAENYNLLSAPILVTFDKDGTCTLNGSKIEVSTSETKTDFTKDGNDRYTLKLTVLNRKTPALPHTGADAPSLWLLIGLPLAVAGLLILVFRYNKKGGRTR